MIYSPNILGVESQTFAFCTSPAPFHWYQPLLKNLGHLPSGGDAPTLPGLGVVCLRCSVQLSVSTGGPSPATSRKMSRSLVLGLHSESTLKGPQEFWSLLIQPGPLQEFKLGAHRPAEECALPWPSWSPQRDWVPSSEAWRS